MSKEDDIDKRISELVDTSSEGMIFEKIIKYEDIPKILNRDFGGTLKADAIRQRDKRDDDFFHKMLRKIDKTGGHND